MITILNFIDGQWSQAAAGGWLDDLEPATGAPLARLPDSGPEDMHRAVSAAEKACPEWSARPVSERARLLERLADLVAEETESLARLESDDTGKPIALARGVDMQRAQANLRFFAGAIQHAASHSHDMGASGFNYTLRRPLGVVACITPWNLPLYLLTWKLAPALAAGNTVVAKPSELTPLTAHALCELALKAGFPPGVINMVHGTGPKAGQALVDDERIRAISFTGGTATGRHIALSSAPRLVKLSLELGGKNPALVFADADLDRSVAGLVRSGFTNQGQMCLCTSRVLVEQAAYDRVRERLVAAVRDLRVGDPRAEETEQGAVISAAHQEKILRMIGQVAEAGGRIHCGGKAPALPGRCREGWFVAPTVIDGLPEDHPAHFEEIFGPVVTLQPFEDEADAIRLANSVRYGLAASIWTRDLACAHRAAAAVEAGIVWVNSWLVRDLRTPFGGLKESGLGREGGFYSLEFFSEPRNICISHG